MLLFFSRAAHDHALRSCSAHLSESRPRSDLVRASPRLQDSERDADSSRLGSDGLIAERIDEKLPYIDDGYVDDSAPDLMKGLGKLFGGK